MPSCDSFCHMMLDQCRHTPDPYTRCVAYVSCHTMQAATLAVCLQALQAQHTIRQLPLGQCPMGCLTVPSRLPQLLRPTHPLHHTRPPGRSCLNQRLPVYVYILYMAASLLHALCQAGPCCSRTGREHTCHACLTEHQHHACPVNSLTSTCGKQSAYRARAHNSQPGTNVQFCSDSHLTLRHHVGASSPACCLGPEDRHATAAGQSAAATWSGCLSSPPSWAQPRQKLPA